MEFKKPNKKISPREMELLKIYKDYEDENGYFPTIRYAGEKMKISFMTISNMLKKLNNKGAIKRKTFAKRELEILIEVK